MRILIYATSWGRKKLHLFSYLVASTFLIHKEGCDNVKYGVLRLYFLYIYINGIVKVSRILPEHCPNIVVRTKDPFLTFHSKALEMKN